MGTPLDVANRKQGAEYHHEIFDNLKGVNLDANDATLSKDEMRQCLNFRLNTLGDLQVRSGYDEFLGDSTSVPIAQMEYVGVVSNSDPSVQVANQTQFRYTVTAVWDSVSLAINLWVVDKAFNPAKALPGQTAIFRANLSSAIAAESWAVAPVADMTEYQNAIVLALYDDSVGSSDNPHTNGGLYQIFPVPFQATPAFPINAATPWRVTRLGKLLSPVPAYWDFEATAQGSLFIFNTQPNQNHTFTPVSDPLTGEQQTIEVKMNAPYWKADNPLVQAAQTRLFVANADETAPQQALPVTDPHHAPARAWGYRVVVRRRELDARGNPLETIDAPSTDFWVQDNEYVPPMLVRSVGGGRPDKEFALDGNGKIQFTDDIYGSTNPLGPNGGSGSWRNDFASGAFDINGSDGFYADDLSGGHTALLGMIGFPDNASYLSLRSLYRGSQLSESQSITTDPYYFTAVSLGWINADDTYYPNGQMPYQVAVPASKLKGAPMTVFDWDAFGVGHPLPQADGSFIGPYQIDIYRTAHTEPLEKDNTAIANQTSGSILQGDLLFQPNTYGLVGTLMYDATDALFGTFTDEIADTAIDFGQSPDDYDGYLVGQFTGRVMREYNQKLLLGNTRTTYWVTSPWKLQQPFINAFEDDAHGVYIPDTMFPLSGAPIDGMPLYAFAYTYVDQLGNESAPTNIWIWITQITNTAAATSVSIVFPRGYDPSIASINLYGTLYDSASQSRFYQLLKSQPVSANMFTINSATEPGAPSNAIDPTKFSPLGTVGKAPSRTVKDYWGPGDLIWTDLNDPFVWPPLNVEVHSETFPITAIDSLLGKAWIWTTNSVTLTQADNEIPRFEEESRDVGCIAPKCAVKYGQVVFFLGAKGLYFAQPSGVVQYPAKVYTEVFKYLAEQIPTQPNLANAMRASIGILERRQELWLYFPSSIDLYTSDAFNAGAKIENALPQEIIVYKFIDGEIGSFYRNSDIRNMQNYTFDLRGNRDVDSFQLQNSMDLGQDLGVIDGGLYRPEHIYFSSHSDGTLWCAYFSARTGMLTLLDADVDGNIWPGYAAVEKPMIVGLPLTQKQMAQVAFKGQLDSDVEIFTGIRKADGSVDAIRGSLDRRTTAWPIIISNPNRSWVYAHRVSSLAFESMGDDWALRILSNPSSRGKHLTVLESMDAYMSLKHHHPG